MYREYLLVSVNAFSTYMKIVPCFKNQLALTSVNTHSRVCYAVFL